MGSSEPVFEVPSSNQLHEELSAIEPSINQVPDPRHVKFFAVSWPSGVTLSQTAKKKKLFRSERAASNKLGWSYTAFGWYYLCTSLALYGAPVDDDTMVVLYQVTALLS